MDRLFQIVSDKLNISKKEVEVIYKDYVSLVRKEMINNPHREIYFYQFGKFVPSVLKIKNKLKKEFYKRNKEKVTTLIKTLRNLNYTPKQ